MTDKEERIRVLVSKNPCEKCDIKPCTRKCMFRTLFEKAPGMTRQEAIEKIKNASEFYLNHKLGCTKEEEAECILNALLGSDK